MKCYEDMQIIDALESYCNSYTINVKMELRCESGLLSRPFMLKINPNEGKLLSDFIIRLFETLNVHSLSEVINKPVKIKYIDYKTLGFCNIINNKWFMIDELTK